MFMKPLGTTAPAPLNLLAISGSIRRDSHCTAVLRSLDALLPAGVTLALAPLDDIPLYNADLDGDSPPAAVAQLKSAIAAADGLVICSPEYNYGMPGVLKNAIDWASRPVAASVLRDKPVVVMGVSPGAGAAARAQQQVRDALIYTGGCVLPEPELLVGAAIGKFDDAGNVTDPELRGQVVDMVTALRGWAERIRMADAQAA